MIGPNFNAQHLWLTQYILYILSISFTGRQIACVVFLFIEENSGHIGSDSLATLFLDFTGSCAHRIDIENSMYISH